MNNRTNKTYKRSVKYNKLDQSPISKNQVFFKSQQETDFMKKNNKEYTINTNNIVINSKITAKDIRDSLWRCRDFELSHLWQRSIFLTTILVLCFTGYGVVVTRMFDSVEYAVSSSTYILNNIALLLCLVNIIFSSLWIMMAKGSKAWYERYEHAIDAFENDESLVSEEVLNSGIRKSSIGGFQFQLLKEYNAPEINDCIFNCQGGAYSPSKINIAIGQISFVIWCAAFIIHSLLYINKFHLDEVWFEIYVPRFLSLLFLCILIFILCILIHPKLNGVWIKSTELHKFRGRTLCGKKKKPHRNKAVSK